MRRMFRVLAAVLVSGGLAACGSDGRTEADVSTPPGAGASPSGSGASPSTTGTAPSTGPASPSPGGGFAGPDQAMARYLADASGARYVGPCAKAKPDPEAVCGKKVASVDAGDVYGVGAPSSEIVGFLLLRQGPDGWRVVDDHVPGGADESTPTWMAGVG